MEYKYGKWFIERYDYEDGSRYYFNEGDDKFYLPRSMATPYDTQYLAKAVAERFKDTYAYSYRVRFFEL